MPLYNSDGSLWLPSERYWADRREERNRLFADLRHTQRNDWPTIARTKTKTIVYQPKHSDSDLQLFWVDWMQELFRDFDYRLDTLNFVGPLSLLYDVAASLKRNLGNTPWLSKGAYKFYIFGFAAVRASNSFLPPMCFFDNLFSKRHFNPCDKAILLERFSRIGGQVFNGRELPSWMVSARQVMAVYTDENTNLLGWGYGKPERAEFHVRCADAALETRRNELAAGNISEDGLKTINPPIVGDVKFHWWKTR